ncbi:MAG: cell division protein FtsQ/DivIB [Acidimicrobiia bacterium]
MTTKAPPHPEEISIMTSGDEPTETSGEAQDEARTGNGDGVRQEIAVEAPTIIRIGDEAELLAAPPPELPQSVHPRLRERRAAVARAVDLRRFRYFVALAGVVLLACLGWAVAKSPIFSVRTIEVSGNQRVDTAAILEASSIADRQAMVDVDLGRARSGIGALAWIDDVSVRRSWPNKIIVSVTERRAATAVADSTGVLWLVDPKGRALEPAREDTIGALPRVIGPAEIALEPGGSITGPQLNGVKVAASLPVSLRAQLVQIDYDANGLVDLLLASGITVRLGTPDRLVDKYVAVLTVLGGPDASKLTSIDVRSPSTPAVSVQTPSTTAKASGK